MLCTKVTDNSICTYAKYKEKGKTNVMLPLIDGKYCKVAVRNIAGFCYNKTHRGYLNIDLLQRHDCVNKNCPFLKKFEDYPYWTGRAAIKRENKKKAATRNKQRDKERQRYAVAEEKANKVFTAAQEVAQRLNYPIIVTRVAPKRNTNNNYEFIINYVSNVRSNDWYNYFDLALILGKQYGGKYTLRHVKYPNGEYVTSTEWQSMQTQS